MDWGLQNRMARILRPATGRTVMLAVDHGYFLGPTSGLERLGETVAPLLEHADSLMLTRGALRTSIPPQTDVPIMLRVSGGTSIVSNDVGTSSLSNESLAVSVEDAIRLNAGGLAVSVFIGTEHERQTLENLTRLIDEGERYGLPVLAVTAVGRDMARDLRYLGLATRICAELGAHLVKTYFCDGFERLVEASPVPVVIAGGKKVPERDALELAHRAIAAGAAGVDMGRNIFQSAAPVAMIRAVRSIVHENATVEDAWSLVAPELER
jgi:putative autoinducer-2 (AI-2) aldolase